MPPLDSCLAYGWMGDGLVLLASIDEELVTSCETLVIKARSESKKIFFIES